MCYSCGHEQSEKGKTIGTGELQTDTGTSAAPEPPPPAEPAAVHEPAPDIAFRSKTDLSSAVELKSVPRRTPIAEDIPAPKHKQRAASSAPSSKPRLQKKKPCPVCRKQMKLHEEEKIWKCHSCDYQRRDF
jgi:hypothetical protein